MALARDLDLDLARSGLLVAALALGIGIGLAGAGPLVDRHPRRPLFVAACLLAAASLLGMSASMSFSRALLLLVSAGVGIGTYGTLVNTMVGERYGERAAKPLSAVHASATLGAMLAPPVIGWLAPRAGWSASFHGAGFAHLLLACAALAIVFPAARPDGGSEDEGGGDGTLSRALVPYAAIVFAYVGIETALTIFALPYATNALDLDASRGLGAISAFWFGLLVGRLGVLGLRRAGDTRLLVAAGGAGFVVIAAAAGLRWIQLEILYAAIGLVLGAVYPVTIALAGQRFPRSRGTATGIAAAFGAAGGMTVPWLHGALGDRVGVGGAVAALSLWALVVALAALLAQHQRGGRSATLSGCA